MLKERRAEQSNIQRELSSLSDRDLPHLVSESADAQATHILCGDFDLKIARQNYFISNQDKVLLIMLLFTLYIVLYCFNCLLLFHF